ncbi:YaaR family protein [Neobacillus massiliamazoniensis]|uniref:YaaR n=1 Tax=Neobacillus massiliamazoniensis TaxID=1499688 RepID=A0A0U1NT72_9BACI|nr:YaaR family protein [Neobacillus massiliamazoniensis]CRK80932.1 YaaR [Neobacillus massiliamazoniensis]
MKIQDQLRINIADPRLNTSERASSNSVSFQKMMNSYSKDISKDHLQQLMQKLDQQGQQLCDNPTFQELRKYKDLVKQFMGDVTKNGIGLMQAETWDPMGGNKTLKTIRVLDRKLLDLTNHVLNEQNSSLSLLDRIGEIKGLLVNLYT